MNEEVREDKFLDLFKGENLWPYFFGGINRIRKMNEDIKEERELERCKITKNWHKWPQHMWIKVS